jgi:hypothetical protein
VFSLLVLGIVVYRYRVRERKKELRVMKRHAAEYVELHKSSW